MNRNIWILYFLFWTAVRANEEPLYRKIGDEAVLTPDSVVTLITSIRWKHGPDIAMEWYGDKTLPYRQYKDRGSLNISTGEMTITGLTPCDSGVYTAEINGKETTKTELQVISPVSKPVLTVSCDRSMTYCLFTCDGSTKDAEPVTYWWTTGEKRWNSTKELRITKEEEEQWFICTLENPVSSISSEKVSNPFKESNRILGLVIMAVVLILLVCIIIYFIHKKIKAADSQRFKLLWQYEGVESGDWYDFIETAVSSATSDDIEKQYQKNRDGKMQLPGEEYELDFKAMTKTNLKTGRVLKIRRVILPPQSPPAVGETSTQDTSTSPPATSNKTVNNTGLRSQWQFQKWEAGWCDFRETADPSVGCSVTNDDIEKWYQEDHLNIIDYKVNNYSYKLNFKKMIQTNQETGHERKIRFVLVPTPHSAFQIIQINNKNSSSDVVSV